MSKPTYEELEKRIKEFEKVETEQMLAEEALRKSETQLRKLIETIPDLVWLKDPQGEYLFCNSRFERFFGAKEADIAGKTDYDFVDKELADLFRYNDKRAMAAGKPSMNEEKVTFADDGHHEILETIKTPLYESDGTRIGVLGIARDITKRKYAEEALRESEERLDLAMSVANDGIWDWDMVKNTVEFDDRYYTMAGYEPQEFQSSFEDWTNHVHPDDIERCKEVVNQYIAGEIPRFDIEFRFRRKDSTLMWIRGRGKIVEWDDEGKPVRFVGTHSDISERKKAEEEREKLILELRSALEEVKTLRGLIPICAKCKKIRDDKGYWNQIEVYIEKFSDAKFSHGLCEECSDDLYGEEDWYKPDNKPKE